MKKGMITNRANQRKDRTGVDWRNAREGKKEKKRNSIVSIKGMGKNTPKGENSVALRIPSEKKKAKEIDQC